MGLDFLDLRFRCEREFQINIDQHELILLFESGKSNSTKGLLTDIKVADFVRLIESTVRRQNPSYEGDIFPAVRRHISDCLAVDESEVVLDAWMGRDLGLEG